MAERLKAAVLKTVVPLAAEPWVRILLPPPAKIFGPPAEAFVARRFMQGRLLVIYIAEIVLFIIISQFYEERWPSRLKALAC